MSHLLCDAFSQASLRWVDLLWPRPAAASTEERNGGANAGDEEQDGREAERPWLAPHILIKVVDKHLRGGRCARCPSPGARGHFLLVADPA